MVRGTPITVAACLACWLACAPALAQGRSAAAEVLFDAGRAAAKAGDHQAACAKFRESHRLEPSAGALLNIGECSERLGKLVDAWQSYNEALKLLAPTDRRLPYAKKRHQAVDARIARLTLRVADDAPAGTQLVKDGVVLGPATHGLALPVEPNQTVHLEARAPGHAARTLEVTLIEGQRRSLAIRPGAPVATAVPPPPTRAPVSPEPSQPTGGVRVSTAIGWSSIALGATFTGVGVISAIDLAGRRADLDDLCNDDGSCQASASDSIDAYNDRRIVSTASFVAGGVFVATGALVLLLTGGEEREAAVVPIVGPGFAGIAGKL